MKKSVFIAALLLAGLTYKASDAQVRLHIGVNFGTAPVVYTPVPVDDVQYSGDDDYYYLPDADAYYSVPEHVYYYLNGNRWVSGNYLPGRFHDFDWRYARHYEVRAPRPYMQHDVYRERFGGFAGGNPDWRAHDNRFNNGNFGPNRGGYNDNNFARRQDYNRGFNRGGNQGYNQPYGQDNSNRGNYGQGDRNNQNKGNYGQPSRGQNNGYQGGQGQFNNQNQNNQPNRGEGQGNNQNGNWQGQGRNQGQNNQPSNNQGGQGHGSFNGQQHFADNNGPAYNRQNGIIRQGQF